MRRISTLNVIFTKRLNYFNIIVSDEKPLIELLKIPARMDY